MWYYLFKIYMDYAFIALNHFVYYCDLLLRFGDVRETFWYPSTRGYRNTRASSKQETMQGRLSQVGKSGSRVSGLWSFRANELPGMPGPCKRIEIEATAGNQARPRAKLSVAKPRNIETQDVLLCHPRTADLLVMNIVARGDTRPANRVAFSQKYVPDTRIRAGSSPSRTRRPSIMRPKCRTSFGPVIPHDEATL